MLRLGWRLLACHCCGVSRLTMFDISLSLAAAVLLTPGFVVGLACWWPCCSTCTICEDTFDRTDSTDVNTGSACGWTEVSGAWEISSNALMPTSTSALLISTAEHPDGVNAIKLDATINSTGSNTRFRLILGYVDTSNFLCAEVRIHSSAGHLKIIEMSGGTETELSSVLSLALPTSTDHTFSFCCNESESRLLATVNSTAITTAISSTSTGVFGIGTGSVVGTTALIKQFTATIRSADCGLCLVAGCGCCDGDDTPENGWDNGGCPVEYKVVSNVTTGAGPLCTAGECAAFNGTFYLAAPSPGATEYTLATGSSCAGANAWWLTIGNIGGTGGACNSAALGIGPSAISSTGFAYQSYSITSCLGIIELEDAAGQIYCSLHPTDTVTIEAV